MSRYTLRGRPDVAGKYVVAAVTGYFYSIACASTTKGVDDSLQVKLHFSTFFSIQGRFYERLYIIANPPHF
jgi:FKBP12-rapamycin complex-associated protein